MAAAPRGGEGEGLHGGDGDTRRGSDRVGHANASAAQSPEPGRERQPDPPRPHPPAPPKGSRGPPPPRRRVSGGVSRATHCFCRSPSGGVPPNFLRRERRGPQHQTLQGAWGGGRRLQVGADTAPPPMPPHGGRPARRWPDGSRREDTLQPARPTRAAPAGHAGVLTGVSFITERPSSLRAGTKHIERPLVGSQVHSNFIIQDTVWTRLRRTMVSLMI